MSNPKNLQEFLNRHLGDGLYQHRITAALAPQDRVCIQVESQDTGERINFQVVGDVLLRIELDQ